MQVNHYMGLFIEYIFFIIAITFMNSKSLDQQDHKAHEHSTKRTSKKPLKTRSKLPATNSIAKNPKERTKQSLNEATKLAINSTKLRALQTLKKLFLNADLIDPFITRTLMSDLAPSLYSTNPCTSLSS